MLGSRRLRSGTAPARHAAGQAVRSHAAAKAGRSAHSRSRTSLGHCPRATVRRRASARAGLCDVRRYRSRRGLSSRRVVDGAAEAGSRVEGAIRVRIGPIAATLPGRRARRDAAPAICPAASSASATTARSRSATQGRNPLSAGADRAGDARRSLHRIHAYRNAGARSEGRGWCAISPARLIANLPAISTAACPEYIVRPKPLRPS